MRDWPSLLRQRAKSNVSDLIGAAGDTKASPPCDILTRPLEANRLPQRHHLLPICFLEPNPRKRSTNEKGAGASANPFPTFENFDGTTAPARTGDPQIHNLVL